MGAAVRCSTNQSALVKYQLNSSCREAAGWQDELKLLLTPSVPLGMAVTRFHAKLSS